ncbi:MAG: glycosyltransferase family 39 protein [Muribaculaceae bacterium]|nr:glycosyltransferase family 39 protein [Muribaculaceae bacterium]
MIERISRNDLFNVRTGWWYVAICVCLITLPFLGLTDFNTKGEPREAVVAYSILSQGDWILPSNNGGEIPYKPPFFHWVIALCSLLTGGEVTEYTSRLPSALALIGMTLGVYAFLARRVCLGRAMVTAMTLFTAFEIYRAGMNCRVDMMLTALSVGAMLLLYRWWERGMRGLPWWAILLMSCATLTKGPVGIIIPCLTSGCFMLFRGMPFLRVFLKLAASGLLALVLPLCWYAAAYGRGGEEFLNLVMEENFGRMTGTMTYESHVNPWWYNIVTLLAGFLPWTIAALVALFLIRRRKDEGDATPRSWRDNVSAFFRTKNPVMLFSATCAVIVFFFYCIPASKRSVYLMPMYPFTAYFVAELLIWMSRRKRGSVLGLGDAFGVLGILLFGVFCLVKCGAMPEGLFGHGRHAAANAAMVESLASQSGAAAWICALVPVCAAAVWWGAVRRRVQRSQTAVAAATLLCALYIAFSGTYQPGLLNAKSQHPLAREIMSRYPDAGTGIYEFIAMAEEAKGNPVHFFELDFYMGDPVRNFLREQPEAGYLLIEPTDTAEWLPQFGKRGYRFQLLREPGAAEAKHTPSLYRFSR